MEKNFQHEERKAQLNFMILASFFLLVPTTSLISKSLQWKAAEPVQAAAVFPADRGAAKPAAALNRPAKTAAAPPKEHRRSQLLADGSSVREHFDTGGRRVSKLLWNSEGLLLNRWNFEPATGRIVRYETRDYRDKALVQRRVAGYQYDADGGFVKTNHVFSPDGRVLRTFVEKVSAKNIKYQEKWYDQKKRPISEKNWDPASGRFLDYVMTAYGVGGLSTQTYMDERGRELRKVLVTPSGKILSAGSLVQFGR